MNNDTLIQLADAVRDSEQTLQNITEEVEKNRCLQKEKSGQLNSLNEQGKEYLDIQKQIDCFEAKAKAAKAENDKLYDDVLELNKQKNSIEETIKRLDAEYTELNNEYERNNQNDQMNGKRKQELEDGIEQLDDCLKEFATIRAENKNALANGESLKNHYDKLESKARELCSLCEITQTMLDAGGDIVVRLNLAGKLDNDIKKKIEQLKHLASDSKAFLCDDKKD